MPHIIIRHKVQDYSTWKSAFDGFVEQRKAGGEKSYQIFQPEDNPNNLVIVFEWNNMENAKAFMQSEILQTTMQSAGVLEAPDIYFTNLVEQGDI